MHFPEPRLFKELRKIQSTFQREVDQYISAMHSLGRIIDSVWPSEEVAPSEGSTPTAENQTRSGGLIQRPRAVTPPEDSHYVPASRLYREHFRSYRGFKRWLTRTPENVVRRYRPRPNRLMIHLADWQAYWRVVDEEAWKRLDEAEARREVVRKRHVNPRRQPETNISKVVETTDAQ